MTEWMSSRDSSFVPVSGTERWMDAGTKLTAVAGRGPLSREMAEVGYG
jgi:hypothetical protein